MVGRVNPHPMKNLIRTLTAIFVLSLGSLAFAEDAKQECHKECKDHKECAKDCQCDTCKAERAAKAAKDAEQKNQEKQPEKK